MIFMSKKNVFERKPEYRDFPPTKENEKMWMWLLEALDIDKGDIKDSDSKLSIHMDRGEEMYETRTYGAKIPIEFGVKILSKINTKTGVMTVLLKTPNYHSNQLEISEEEYLELVNKFEKETKQFIDIENVNITTREDLKKYAKDVMEGRISGSRIK